MPNRNLIAQFAIAAALAVGGCGPSKPPGAYERGRLVYMTNCIICHNADPSLPGTQGPAIAGSSQALVAARVLHLAYPPGYQPKRRTHAMRAFPHMTPQQIGDLTVFLARRRKPGG
ncbi:MAG TPA: cytochrome c [Candidatus Binataceae bacterium]|nr:cytochrome c [Candidatus Binataceae bacterium]